MIEVTVKNEIARYHRKTWDWASNEASSVGFEAQEPRIGSYYLFTEAGELLDAWLRENTTALRRNNRKSSIPKEVCDVIMMACLSIPEDYDVSSLRGTTWPPAGTVEDIVELASTVMSLWIIADNRDPVDEDWLNSACFESMITVSNACAYLSSVGLNPWYTYTQHLDERYRMMKRKTEKESLGKKWTHETKIIEHITDRILQMEGRDDLTDDEVAIRYMTQQIERNGSILSKVAGQAAVPVPDSDCLDTMERYGALLEKNAEIESTLRSFGMTGKMDNLSDWLTVTLAR